MGMRDVAEVSPNSHLMKDVLAPRSRGHHGQRFVGHHLSTREALLRARALYSPRLMRRKRVRRQNRQMWNGVIGGWSARPLLHENPPFFIFNPLCVSLGCLSVIPWGSS